MNIRRTEKGVTLLALVITVIILLIIATVALRTINNKDMIEYAQNATEEFEGVQKEEQQYVAEIGTSAKDNLGGLPENYVPKVTYTDERVPVPAGFKVVEGTKDTGLVIENETEGSQFVWIPVEDINEMAMCQECRKNYNKIDVKTLKCENCGGSKFAGKLYGKGHGESFDENSSGQEYGKYATCKEPAVLTKKYDNTTNSYVDGGSDNESENLEKAGLPKGSTIDDFEKYIQNNFNKMITSVAKYKGFYVGRYETSLNANKVQSKAGVLPEAAAGAMWYEIYAKSRTYLQGEVVSEMIWGCQWDAMMKFIGNKATTINNTLHDYDNIYETGNRLDIANNIYDLEGNVPEMTQEAYSLYARSIRGGSFSFNSSPSYRSHLFVSSEYSTTIHDGSRLALYIE